MARDEDYLKHLLELEYGIAQESIDKFDEYRARLKGWMITAAAGIAAFALSSHTPTVFWAGVAMVTLFGLAEISYIDIQEDAINRSQALDALIESMSREGIGPEHDEYVFGIGKVFGGGRFVRPRTVLYWMGYRTFNPILYAGLLILMTIAALVAPTGK